MSSSGTLSSVVPAPQTLQERLGRPAEGEHRKAEKAAKLVSSTAINLRIPERGLALAKAIAEKKGLPYQTYLKMLIHEGLERDKTVLG